LGSEDGRAVLTDESWQLTARPIQASPAKAAINGIANCGGSLAFSTTQEVMVMAFRGQNPDPASRPVVTSHGTHGIAAAPGGYFVAPLGRSGIMLLKPDSLPGDPVGMLTTDKPDMYFYRVAAIRGGGDEDLLFSACRQGGLGVTASR
jgi:hypothetical protein